MPTPLEGRKILVVDDVRDICDLIREELGSACEVEGAETYAIAREKLASKRYDVAILDIMGVRGFDLLAEFRDEVSCIILTAHALAPADLERSVRGRAALYLPKDELGRIEDYVEKVLTRSEPLWPWLFRRLDFGQWFGEGWTPPEVGSESGVGLRETETRS